MHQNLIDSLAVRMNVEAHGQIESYSTPFNNIVVTGPDGEDTHYMPPANLRLMMFNIPAVNRDGEPVIMSKDEIVLCRLGLPREILSKSRRASMDPKLRRDLEFYESLDVLEYQARIEIAYGKCDMVAPQEALERHELSYLGPDLEKMVLDGVMDTMFVDDRNYHGGGGRSGRPQKTSIDLYWLRRIIRKQKPGDKLTFGRYFVKLTGDIRQTIAGDSRFITHVIFGRLPDKNARVRPLDRISGRLGQDGRGFIAVLQMQDIRHGIETYTSQIVPEPEGRGTMHEIWLIDHPTPICMDDPGLDKFLAHFAPQQTVPEPEVLAEEAGGEAEAEQAEAEPQAEAETEPPVPEATTSESEGAATSTEEPQPDPESGATEPAEEAEAEQAEAEPQAEPVSAPETVQEAPVAAASQTADEDLPPEVRELLSN